jgi:hypothetical protein
VATHCHGEAPQWMQSFSTTGYDDAMQLFSVTQYTGTNVTVSFLVHETLSDCLVNA